jgi:hypothetical protein
MLFNYRNYVSMEQRKAVRAYLKAVFPYPPVVTEENAQEIQSR